MTRILPLPRNLSLTLLLAAAAVLVIAASSSLRPPVADAVAYSNCSEVRTTGTSHTSGGGALMVRQDVDALTDNASTVVAGTVESFQSCYTSDNPGYITIVTVSVNHPLKGDAPGEAVQIAVDGGVVDGQGMAVGISPEFTVGERIVAFLDTNNVGETVLSDDYQSKMTVLPNGTIEGHEGMTIEALSQAVGAAAAGELSDASDPLTEGPQIIESGYAFTGPWIHNNIHPVTVNINASHNKPSQLTVEDSRLAIIHAFQSWQTLPDNYIAFNFANTTRTNTQSACDGKFDVTWGIDEAHGSSTLAVTFTCYIGSETKDADIEIDTNHFGSNWRTDGSGSCASNNVDLETVILHEAGHFIGLDHPSANNCAACPIMNASYGGVSRTPCTDDKNGAADLYSIANEDPPIPPSGLSAVSTANSINISWVDVAKEQGFEIWRAAEFCASAVAGDFELHNSIKDNVVTYIDTDYDNGLPANQPFCYKVRSFNNGGESAFGPLAEGAIGSVATPEATPTATPSVAPSPPQAPSATPTLAPTPSLAPTPTSGPVKGDADCDQHLTVMDSLNILSTEADVGDADCIQNADMDCSGTVDAHDAIVVLLIVSGVTQPSEACS